MTDLMGVRDFFFVCLSGEECYIVFVNRPPVLSLVLLSDIPDMCHKNKQLESDIGL